MGSDIDTSRVIQELITIRDFIRWGFSEFNRSSLTYGHGCENAWDEIHNLVYSSLHLPPDTNKLVLSAKLLTSERDLLVDRIKQRIEKQIPVAYLINEAWFAGLSFYVDQRVIIPRSPMAELIEAEFSPWVEEGSVNRILDLCTGSGCIAIACAMQFPNAKVDAVDINSDALDVAKINVERYGLEENVELVQSDLFEKLGNQKYDIIISNPPYVPKSVYQELPKEYQYEPSVALEAGEDGLQIVRRILQTAHEHLTSKGVLIVEVGELQPLLEIEFPDVPFTWLVFEHGDDGVFLLTYEELNEFRHLW